jgi:hypothetical protein
MDVSVNLPIILQSVNARAGTAKGASLINNPPLQET